MFVSLKLFPIRNLLLLTSSAYSPSRATITFIQEVIEPKIRQRFCQTRVFLVLFRQIDYESLEIDHAENQKERIGLLSNFPANLLFFELATGASELKRETARPTTKNQDRRAENRPFKAVFDSIVAIFHTQLRAYRTYCSTIQFFEDCDR